MTDRLIRNTDEPTRYPWPDDVYLQGGTNGLVAGGAEGPYRTAFVEAFPEDPGTFLRGEGDTVAVAEDACWVLYQRMTACPEHPRHGPFQPRHLRNGSGFCTTCGTWLPKVMLSADDTAGR